MRTPPVLRLRSRPPLFCVFSLPRWVWGRGFYVSWMLWLFFWRRWVFWLLVVFWWWGLLFRLFRGVLWLFLLREQLWSFLRGELWSFLRGQVGGAKSLECPLVLKVDLEVDRFPRLGCSFSLHGMRGSAWKILVAGLRLWWPALFLRSLSSSLWVSGLVVVGWLDHRGRLEFGPSL